MSVSKPRFFAGDKVFAKMKGYPHWPARVITFINATSSYHRYQIHFYGTNQTAVVKGDSLCSYLENKVTLGKPKKHKYFNEALAEIEEELNIDKANHVKIEPTQEETFDSETGGPSGSKTEMVVIASTSGINRKKQKMDDNTFPKIIQKVPVSPAEKDGKKTPGYTTPKLIQKIPTSPADKDIKKTPTLKHKLVHADTEGNQSKPKKARKSTGKISSPVNNAILPGETSHLIVKLKRLSPSRVVKSEPMPVTSIKQEVEEETVSDKTKKDKKKKTKDKKRDYITATHINGEKIKIPLYLNRPNFTDKGTALSWRKLVREYANLLKKRIECGKKVGDVHDLMNDFTSLKSFEFTNQNIPEDNSKKLKFLRIEAQLLDIDIEIKKSLSLSDATPEKCIDLLDQLDNLNITPLMLKKQPDVVLTIRKMRNYVGNIACWNLTNQELKRFKEIAKLIRMKSVLLYNKFKQLFENRSLDHFWTFFTKEVDIFREKTAELTLTELLSIVEEPA